MAKPRKFLKKPRSLAFFRQAGLCCYCEQPMWSKDPHEFALKHQITPGQARLLECTGDHLKAHRDAGSASQSNIAAACRFCNNNRHKRKEPPPPDQFKKLIKQRISQGRWHGLRLIE